MHFFFDIIIIFVCLYYLSLFCVLVLGKGVCRKFGYPLLLYLIDKRQIYGYNKVRKIFPTILRSLMKGKLDCKLDVLTEWGN